MPGKIIANRPEVSRSFAVLGFTIRTGVSPSWFEVAFATDPRLFRPEAKTQRTPANFYSTRSLGAMPAERGEAVYLAPPEVLDRFVGQPRLYYMLASFRQPDGRDPEIVWTPTEIAPYVTISKSFIGSPRRIDGANGRSTGNGYGQPGNIMEWAGDQAAAGQVEPVNIAPAVAGAEARVGASVSAPAAGSLQPAAVASSYDLPYDDGLDTGLWRMLEQNESKQSQDDHYGIDGPIPDASPSSTGQAYSRSLEASEYPQASRFEPANPANYGTTSSPRTIDRIVIHITDGSRINGTISWFKNPDAQVSAHYIVGQDGEVVQMVHHEDVAWHAHSANRRSIGIEHVANTRGLAPTESQYCASAALVTWLCDQYGLPLDRDHIMGHAEADPSTTHQQCPNAIWDWDYYMGLITSRSCYPLPQGQAVSAGQSYSANAQAYRGNGHGNGNGQTRTRSRPMSVEVASAIAGAVITRILDNDGDVEWTLEQMRGMKHVQDNAQNAGSAGIQERTVRVDGPVMNTLLGQDKIYLDCEINFQYDGRSVGNVSITPVDMSDAVGAGLIVQARIMDDNRVYTQPPDTTSFAAIKIEFLHHFTGPSPLQDDDLKRTNMTIYGNGTYGLQYHW